MSGAVAAIGGWFDAAPGTPLASTPPLAPPWSVVCWLRIETLASAPWFGLNSSDVASVCEKSTSAVTLARRLSWPTIGSTSSRMRLV